MILDLDVGWDALDEVKGESSGGVSSWEIERSGGEADREDGAEEGIVELEG